MSNAIPADTTKRSRSARTHTLAQRAEILEPDRPARVYPWVHRPGSASNVELGATESSDRRRSATCMAAPGRQGASIGSGYLHVRPLFNPGPDEVVAPGARGRGDH